MTDSDFPISRRRLIAAGGVAGLGTLGAGAASATFSSGVDYRHSAVLPAQSDRGVSLRIDWTEWYNGDVVERRPAGGGPQPSIEFDGLLPGDTGRVAFGIRVDTRGPGDGGPGDGGPGDGGPGDGGPGNGDGSGARVRVRLREEPESGAENGRTEPEIAAGDDTPATGELGDFLDVALWRDAGVQVGDLVSFGSCDGEFTPGDRVLDEGTFSEVAVEADEPGEEGWLDVTAEGECLGPDEKLCVGFEWSVGASNLIQTDGVAFAIDFQGRHCEE